MADARTERGAWVTRMSREATSGVDLRRVASGAGAIWAIAVLLMAPGCRSTEQPRPAPQPPIAAAAAATDAPETGLMISAVELSEGDGAGAGAEVVISATGPVIWTSYRDLDGNVVVELPDALPAAGVAGTRESDGLVSRLEIGSESSGRLATTRLVISTRGEVEHSLHAEGNRLAVDLVPAAQAAAEPAPGRFTFEPIAEEEPAETAEEAAPFEAVESLPVAEPGSAAMAGTPDAPYRGPDPRGAPASRLSSVTVQSAGETTVVELHGDGEFAYSTFRLGDPERFVIDLAGVVDQVDTAMLPVTGPVVERVRVAQFRSFPDPVARVVFDLARPATPELERTPGSLVVRFGPGSRVAPARSARPAPAPAFAVEPSAPVAVIAQASPPEREEPVAVVIDQQPDPEDLDFAPEELAQDIEIRNLPEEGAPPARPAPPVVELEAPRPSEADLFATTRVDPPPARGAAAPEPAPGFGTQRLSGERVYFGDPIDMTLRDADVVETLRSFAKISGLNIVIQPDVQGRVTVELENVPWDQALEQILRINGLGYEIEGNIMRIAPLATLRVEAQERQQLAAAQALSIPLQTVMKRLSYTSARNLARVLARGSGGGILSQRGTVIVDERTNTLIISELPEYMDTVLAIIENLDEPEPQVMIEARIIETTKRFSRELGISWGFDYEGSNRFGNTTGLQFPNNIDASGGVGLGTAGRNGLLNLSLGNILNTFELDAVLNAAESDGLVNILSTPKVATLNNHRAIIQSGLQIPIQTVSNNTVTVQFINATLRLEVTPQITADGTVVMDILIQKREVQSAFVIPGATNAPIATKEAQTQVLVRDGGTAVIGGIYEVSADRSEARVPGLGRIPIIGYLFRNQNRTDENEELLIFITPRIVRL